MKTILRSLEVERRYIMGAVHWELHFWQIFNYCVAAVSQNALVVKCPISDSLAAEWNFNADELNNDTYEMDITDENKDDVLKAYNIIQPDF